MHEYGGLEGVQYGTGLPARMLSVRALFDSGPGAHAGQSMLPVSAVMTASHMYCGLNAG